MAVNLLRLLEDLKVDEGLRLYPYPDTADPPKTTIGFGRNLTDMGISTEEAISMLKNDMTSIVHELQPRLLDMNLSESVERALCNMAYNMGVPRLKKFKKMWAALVDHHYATAADEALDSKWARQVGARAKRIADMIREG